MLLGVGWLVQQSMARVIVGSETSLTLNIFEHTVFRWGAVVIPTSKPTFPTREACSPTLVVISLTAYIFCESDPSPAKSVHSRENIAKIL